MKYPLLTLPAGVCSVPVLPPAPFSTLSGTGCDEIGQIAEVSGARVILPKGNVEIGRAPIKSSLQPEQNHELRRQLDHARSPLQLYSPEAAATQAALSVRIETNGQVFLPIQLDDNLTAGKDALSRIPHHFSQA